MFKKIIIGILLVSVAGAGGAALANQSSTPEEPTTIPSPIAVSQEQGIVQPVAPTVAAQESFEQPWEAEGTITSLSDYGLTLTLDNGETVEVELGPPEYWQAQETKLQTGLQATIIGTENEGMYHASQVVLADGQILQLRTEEGQPLWSGGVDNGQGGNAAQGDGDHVPEPQAQADEWVTISGTLMAFQGGNMTMSTFEGELLSFQTGQPRFFAGQGVSFQVGDEIVVVGYFDGEQFVAGDITQAATGLRVMLRDPNGRPLWAGPGNGNGKGNGQGGQ
jgi:hypothetical protein